MPKKHIVWVCMMQGKGRCVEKGSEALLKRFQTEVFTRGLDNVKVIPTGCSDRHDYGPAVLIDPEDVWYCRVSPEDVTEIVEEHTVNGKVVHRLVCPI